jgi:hypothetical protein
MLVPFTEQEPCQLEKLGDFSDLADSAWREVRKSRHLPGHQLAIRTLCCKCDIAAQH